MTDDADRQVREVLTEVYAAWDANDADACAKPYAESATATLPGAYLPGRHDGSWLVQAFHNGPEQVNRDAQ